MTLTTSQKRLLNELANGHYLTSSLSEHYNLRSEATTKTIREVRPEPVHTLLDAELIDFNYTPTTGGGKANVYVISEAGRRAIGVEAPKPTATLETCVQCGKPATVRREEVNQNFCSDACFDEWGED